MYLSSSSLLYHFIKCSTCFCQVSYLLQPNLLPNIKRKKTPSAFSSSKSPFSSVFLAEGTPEDRSVCLRLIFAHMVNLYTPLGGHIDPSWWIYISSTVSIYTYHDEYIALLSSLKKLNALKALPLAATYSRRGCFGSFPHGNESFLRDMAVY